MRPLAFTFGVTLLLFKTSFSENNLQSLHVLFRHGAKTPSKSYLNDPFRDYPWGPGWSQLTNTGKLDVYTLGQIFRDSYSHFIPRLYSPEDLYILSSYADRCIMSAQLFLAGLYPPVDEQIWNPSLQWQPIPVKSVERSEDNKLALKKPCPKYEKALKEAYGSDEIMKLNYENIGLYDILTRESGEDIQNISTLESLYNTLDSEKTEGLILPKWTSDLFPNKMNTSAAMALAIFTQTEFMKQMHGGELVKEIVSHITRKINGTLKPDRKLFLYSGHDLTVVTLLRILGYPELIKPDFAASVIIEHYANDEKHNAVKFFYKANTTTAPIEFFPYYCTEMPCSFQNFTTRMGRFISPDWDKACKDI